MEPRPPEGARPLRRSYKIKYHHQKLENKIKEYVQKEVYNQVEDLRKDMRRLELEVEARTRQVKAALRKKSPVPKLRLDHIFTATGSALFDGETLLYPAAAVVVKQSAHGRQQTFFQAHRGHAVLAIDRHPRFQEIYASASCQECIVWTKDLIILTRFQDKTKTICAVAFSVNALLAIVSSENNLVTLYDWRTQSIRATCSALLFSFFTKTDNCLTFLHDRLSVYTSATKIDKHYQNITALNAASNFCLAGTATGLLLRFTEMLTLDASCQLKNASILSIAITEDTNKVAVALRNGPLILLDLTSLHQLTTIDSIYTIKNISFVSPENKLLLNTAQNSMLIDLNDKTHKAAVLLHRVMQWKALAASNATLLAAVSDRYLFLFKDKILLQRILITQYTPSHLAFHPSTETLALGCQDGHIVLATKSSEYRWRLRHRCTVLQEEKNVINCLNYTPDGRYLLVGSPQHIHVLTTENSYKVHSILKDVYMPVRFDFLSASLLQCSEKNEKSSKTFSISLWDVPSFNRIDTQSTQMHHHILTVRSHQSKHKKLPLFAAPSLHESKNPTVHRHPFQHNALKGSSSLENQSTFFHSQKITSLTFSPDNTVLFTAAAGQDAGLAQWSLAP